MSRDQLRRINNQWEIDDLSCLTVACDQYINVDAPYGIRCSNSVHLRKTDIPCYIWTKNELKRLLLGDYIICRNSPVKSIFK